MSEAIHSMLVASAALPAAVLSAWMLRRARGAGLPGCGAGSPCDAVMQSRWSRWGPAPVTLPGTLVYLLAFSAAVIATATTSQTCLITEAGLVALAPLIAGAALWFMALQGLVIRRFCIYCTATHLLGVTLAGLVLTDKQTLQAAGVLLIPIWLLALPSIIGLAALIGGQVFLKPKQYAVTLARPVQEPPTLSLPAPVRAPAAFTGAALPQARKPADGTISLLSGQIVLPADAGPILGLAPASRTLVFLFDYTCDVCHHLHDLLTELIARHPGDLAVMLLPVPSDPTCNPLITKRWTVHAGACAYARLALWVWLRDPGKFPEFDHWLCRNETPPPLPEAIVRAGQLVDLDGLDPRIADSDLEPIIRLGVDTLTKSGSEKTPVLLLSNAKLDGRPENMAELWRVIKDQLT